MSFSFTTFLMLLNRSLLSFVSDLLFDSLDFEELIIVLKLIGQYDLFIPNVLCKVDRPSVSFLISCLDVDLLDCDLSIRFLFTKCSDFSLEDFGLVSEVRYERRILN